jgi:hypothetical protein
MTEVLHTYEHLLPREGGGDCVARACGREVAGGLWEGWLEFLPADGSPVVRSERETTQPNRIDLEYWAGGLTRVYLEGALRRTAEPVRPVRRAPEQRPAYDGPAPPRGAARPAAPVLDPFALAARGRERLRRELSALDERHLRRIARAYRLADEHVTDLDALGRGALAELIEGAVARRQDAPAAAPVPGPARTR